MNAQTTQTYGNTPQNNSNKSGNQYQNSAQGSNYKPYANYPKKRSAVSMIAGIVMILIGISYIVDKFLPWVFEWLDSGLVFAVAAIIVGFALLIKK